MKYLLGVLSSVSMCAGLLPSHGWNTLSEQVFFHSSNKTGPYADGAVELMAKFPMVTIEKWMAIDNNKDMSDNIDFTLKRVKKVNPNTSVIFYTNSICDFPQYKSLYDAFNAQPQNWLRNTSNLPIFQKGCSGWSGMPVFDFSKAEVRDLWSGLCLNATAAGADGCFVDRALGVEEAINQAAYDAGHLQVIQDLQKSVGPDGVVIANHAYSMPNVNAAQLEFCNATAETLSYLKECEQNKKICQCHAKGSDPLLDTLAAYLIGAYSGEGYGSYFGFGGWASNVTYNASWDEEHWPTFFDYPLGEPSPATFKDNFYVREFTHATATLNLTTSTGTVTWH